MVTSQDIKVFIAEEIMEIKARSRKPDSGGVGFLFYDEGNATFDEEGLHNSVSGSTGTFAQPSESGYNEYFTSSANKNPFGHGMDKEEEVKVSSEKTISDFTAEEIAEMEAKYNA